MTKPCSFHRLSSGTSRDHDVETFIERVWGDCDCPGCFTQFAILVEFLRSSLGLETVESIALKIARPPDEVQASLDHLVQVGLILRFGTLWGETYYRLTSDQRWLLQLVKFGRYCFASKAALRHFYHRLMFELANRCDLDREEKDGGLFS